MFKYFPHTPSDVDAMLKAIGVKSIDDLYTDVPAELRFQGDYALPSAKSEIELRQWMRRLAAKNKPLVCFAGAGVYDHYIPAIIPSLVERSEFLTSYTPYQAEISQGTLHYIFEYQTMMASLTGMDVSNASMYDGTTATAEAAMMAVAASHKADRVLISSTVDTRTAAVVRTYAHVHGFRLEQIAEDQGATSRADLTEMLADATTAELIDFRDKTVEEFAVVADDDGGAVEGTDGLFQHVFRLHIEVIRRLVENEQVHGFQQQANHCQPTALAARQHFYFFVRLLAAEHKRTENVVDAQADFAACHSVDGLENGERLVEQLRLILGEVADLHVVADFQISLERNLAHDTLHERGFSLTVLADESHFFAAFEGEIDIGEH